MNTNIAIENSTKTNVETLAMNSTEKTAAIKSIGVGLIAHFSCSSKEFKSGKGGGREKRIRALQQVLGFDKVNVVTVVEGLQYKYAFSDAARILKHAHDMKSDPLRRDMQVCVAIDDLQKFLKRLNPEMIFMLQTSCDRLVDIDELYSDAGRVKDEAAFAGMVPVDDDGQPLEISEE